MLTGIETREGSGIKPVMKAGPGIISKTTRNMSHLKMRSHSPELKISNQLNLCCSVDESQSSDPLKLKLSKISNKIISNS